jgi:formylglycine-generating enzyme required for sulfatase activity
MKANPLRQKHPGVTRIVALVLMLAPAGLLLSSPGRGSHAQQESNRQLDRTGSTNASNGKRVALVIGNGAYTNAPPLKNPPNDARDMAATLRALGFDVTNGMNVNQRDMKRLIREFGQKLKTGGSGLFYYAGHGVQSKGRNYLIPVDANITSEAEVEDSGVDVSLVLNFMDDAQNGLNIVILDACRNNPFSRSFRSASNGLAQVDAPTGTLIAYATAPGRVASDGTGQNGLYTSELLKQMRVAGLSATEMFMRVRAEVMKQTANKQVPWEASSLVGAFYFIAPKSAGTPAEPASESKVDSAAFELSYWETIKNSTYAEDFRAYLEKYPSGQFASLAKNRISSLDASTRRVESKPVSNDVSPTELAFWDSIKNSNDPEDFKDYLSKYPGGQFNGLAQRRIAVLANTAKTQPTNTQPSNSGGNKPSEPAGAANTGGSPPKSFKSQQGIEMVYIPPGEFMMGSENGEKDERPVHRVTISQAFYIGRYEVTQAQWQSVMGDNPSGYKNCGGNCPVENVSWDESQNFINKLNESNDGFRYRLPTEAEWEYACRAGTTGDYAGDLDSMAWYEKNSGKKTHPVGTRQPNGFGLYDMHGNVWEWCEDWYHKTYEGAPTDGSAWLGGGEQKKRVLRGGSHYSNAANLRSANRYYYFSPVNRYSDSGFRVVAMLRTP